MEYISELKSRKNLLAYSGGTDSNYLFFKLIEHNIDFDIIHINYNSREQSKDEEKLARKLATTYNKKIFVLNVESKDYKGSFEKWARDIRYQFFDITIEENNYDNLILGHNLNDRVEWTLMQFTKGAGFVELYGMNPIDRRKNYTIIRPIIKHSKHKIIEYLDKKDIKYYYDESNDDQKYRRNFFRHNFVNQLVNNFEKGLNRSYEIMSKELNVFNIKFNLIYNSKKLHIIEYSSNVIKVIDRYIKYNISYLLSYEQKKILETCKELVIMVENNYYSISYNNKYIFIGIIEDITMDKKFKEACRIKKIPRKIRPTIYSEDKEIINMLNS